MDDDNIVEETKEPQDLDDQPTVEPLQSKRTVSVPVVVIVAALSVLLGFVSGFFMGSSNQPATSTQPPAPTTPSAVVSYRPLDVSKFTTQTTPTKTRSGGIAPYGVGENLPTVEVYVDYVCPFCKKFESSYFTVLNQLAGKGKINLVTYPVSFLTEDSPRAANASFCVYEYEKPEVWSAFHMRIFENQSPTEEVGQYTLEKLTDLAKKSGAQSADTFKCVENMEFKNYVTEATNRAHARGLTGTPLILFDGKSMTSQDFAQVTS